ncbi:hypothetical protein [Mycobacterium sp. NPDC050853]
MQQPVRACAAQGSGLLMVCAKALRGVHRFAAPPARRAFYVVSE